MKCKFCNGSGKDYWCRNGEPYPCPVCDGTGEYEPFDADIELDKLYPTEQTNEEYIRTASTNDMARCIATKLCELAKREYGIYDVVDYANIFEWLKEKHNEKY